MQRKEGNVRNPRGEPFGFIGATDMRKATIRLDLHACHDPSPRHVTGYAPAIPILSLRRRVGCFVSPSGPGLFTIKRDTGQKAFLWPAKAQEFEGWPISDFDGHPKAPL